MVQIKVGEKYVTAQGTRPYLTSVKALGLVFADAKQVPVDMLAHELKVSTDALIVVEA